MLGVRSDNEMLIDARQSIIATRASECMVAGKVYASSYHNSVEVKFVSDGFQAAGAFRRS